jgi:hypothetical protein
LTPTTTSTSSSIPFTLTQPNTSKLLSQQLPSTLPTNSGALAVAQLNSLKSVNTNAKITNPIVITKTIAGSNISNAFNEFNSDPNHSNRKQVITSIKNDSKNVNRPLITTSNTTSTITPVTLTTIASNNSSQMANSNGSHLSVSRAITTINNNHLQQNVKKLLLLGQKKENNKPMN